MGKGFNNYMCKKFFHPGSIDNLKRVWMAQQKTDAEQKQQEELKSQYDKEQELYNNKALLAKGENKEKLSLNFMYEPPAGMKKEREREDGEPEFKFEWQRKYNGPRESYLSKDDDTIRDQPFGIQVRNVRCIKCKKWGHINTDKECELYTAPWELTNPTTSMDPLELMRGMRDGGLALKAGVVEGTEPIPVHQLIASDDEASDEETEEMKFIKSLSQKDKLKLLKKLSKLQKKRKKKQKKKKSKSKKESSDSGSSSDSDDTEKESKLSKYEKKAKRHSVSGDRDHARNGKDEKKRLTQHSDREHKRADERRRQHSSSDSDGGHKLSKKYAGKRKERRGAQDKIIAEKCIREDERRDRKRRQRTPESDSDGSRHHVRSKERHERDTGASRGRKRSDSGGSLPDRKRVIHDKKDKKESRSKEKVHADDEMIHKKHIKREDETILHGTDRHSEREKKRTEKRRQRLSSSSSRSPERAQRRDKRR